MAASKSLRQRKSKPPRICRQRTVQKPAGKRAVADRRRASQRAKLSRGTVRVKRVTADVLLQLPRHNPRKEQRVGDDRETRQLDKNGVEKLVCLCVLQCAVLANEVHVDPVDDKDPGEPVNLWCDISEKYSKVLGRDPAYRIEKVLSACGQTVSIACGKKVRLEMEGKETELDKTLIEAIKDPLTHIVRNSVDHGIEPPEVRA